MIAYGALVPRPRGSIQGCRWHSAVHAATAEYFPRHMAVHTPASLLASGLVLSCQNSLVLVYVGRRARVVKTVDDKYTHSCYGFIASRSYALKIFRSSRRLAHEVQRRHLRQASFHVPVAFVGLLC